MKQAGFTDILPLTPMQEGFLFHALYDEDATDLYVVQFNLDLHGPLDAGRLRTAAEALLRRHPNLTAGFRLTGRGQSVQVIPRHVALPWHEIDLSGKEPAERETALAAALADDRERRFDLARPPLIRCTLVEMQAQRYRFALSMHHILIDGWSVPLLVQDLLALYENGGDEKALPPVPPYRDFLAWLSARDRSAAEAAWREALRELPGPSRFAPQERSASPSSSMRITKELPTELGAALAALARQHGLTLNTVFQGAWGMLLGLLTGRRDVIFGATVAGRPPEVPEVEKMVGLFINTLPVRVRYAPDECVLNALSRLQDQQSVLLDHQHLGLVDIQQLLGIGELFDTLVAFESYPADADALHTTTAGIRVGDIDTHDGTHYPLTLLVVPGERALVRLDFQPHLIERQAADQLLECLVRLLETVADDPDRETGRIDLRPSKELTQVLARWQEIAERDVSGAWRSGTEELTKRGRAPRTPQEEILCGLFAEVLSLPKVLIDDDFFELGGHSLLATRLTSRVRTTLGVELHVRALFEAPTVASLAPLLETGRTSASRLTAVPRPERVPLSFAQQRMWFLNQFGDANPALSMPLALRLSGELDPQALNTALNLVIARHESLRTVILESAQSPHQVVLDADAVRVEVPVTEITGPGLADALAEAARQVFDLAVEPPVRVHLYRTGPEEHVLLVLLHHVAADGWSLVPLAHDLAEAYAAACEARETSWSPMPVQYADYALWQRKMLGDETDPESRLSKQLSYWTDALAGLPEKLNLPFDRPRVDVAAPHADAVPLWIDAELHALLWDLARSTRASLFMVLQAGLSALFSRLGAGSDIPIGSPIAGRTDDSLDNLVGLFVNTLVLRTDVSGEPSFRELIKRVRTVNLSAYAHQDLPFERLVEAMNPARTSSYPPLVQVMLAFQNNAMPEFQLPGLRAGLEPVDLGVSQFELAVHLSEQRTESGQAAGIEGWIQYRTQLFDRSSAERLGERLIRLLTAAVNEPDLNLSRIDLLDTAERGRLVGQPDESAVRARPMHAVFEEQAAVRGSATALVWEAGELTYAELNSRANRLARLLVDRGVGPEQVVALVLPRSAELIVSILAVLKTGAAYLPVAPDYPDERIAFMIADSAPRYILADSTVGAVPLAVSEAVGFVEVSGLWREIEAYPDNDLTDADRIIATDPAQAGYVIYTSGSTGRPKGVVVTHAGFASFTAAELERFQTQPGSRVLQLASPSFDASVLEVWMAFAAGATLVLAPTSPLVGRELAEALRRWEISHAFIAPAALATVPESELPALTTIVVGGDACPPTVAARWSQDRRFVNAYGPTECTVAATMSEPLDATSTPSIGRPIPGSRVYVLDDRLRLVPPGVVGELHIAGAGLARGYQQRPGLTAERFVADPFGPPGTRMYRTGDRASWNSAGQLEFFGRADAQIKLRGFRIEPGEIEAVLQEDRRVARAAVTVRETEGAEPYLVAYLVPVPRSENLDDEQPELDTKQLGDRAARTLPSYMVPTSFVRLDALPLTSSGKLDHSALPVPEPMRVPVGRQPQTPREEILCQLFAEILGQRSVWADSDFFELGGHSLLATQLMARIRTTFGVELPVRALFDAPTVGGLVKQLEEADLAQPALRSAQRPASVPLSPAQRRMWLLYRIGGPSPTYNIPLVLRMSGPLSRSALRQALRDVVQRHESLRTVFLESEDGVHQQILDVEEAWREPSVVDASEPDLPSTVAEAVRYGFDLAAEPPMRVWLYTVGPEEHVLTILLHHIAGDGSSLGPLIRDLTEAYEARKRGQAPVWEPLAVQYADYTLWQAELLGDEDDPGSRAARQLAYWKAQLADIPESLWLPAERPRPQLASYQGDLHDIYLPAGLHAALARLARESGTTLFMVLQAALAALLSRLGSGPDIPIGTPIAGRTDNALHQLVGFFANTLVMRTDTSGDPSFRDLLDRVRSTALAAYAHQDLPFERLVEVLNPKRSLSHQPLFQVLLAVQNMSLPDIALPELRTVVEQTGTGSAKFDLSFFFREQVADDGGLEGIAGVVEFSTDLFDRETVVEIGDRLRRLLVAVTDDPAAPISRLDVLTPSRRALPERHDVLATEVVPECEPSEYRRPETAREQILCELFAEILDVDRVGLDDDFFALGGHSFGATRLVSKIRVALGADLALRNVFESPTVAVLAERLDEGADHNAFDVVLPLRSQGDQAPLFCLHPAGGLSWCYTGIVGHIGKNRPVYGLQSPRLSGDERLPVSLEESAAEFIERIRTVQPEGPYHLLGWSFGGHLAYTIATQLQRLGEQVGLLAMLDAFPVQDERMFSVPEEEVLPALFQAVIQQLDGNQEVLQGNMLMETIRREGSVLGELEEFHLQAIKEICLHSMEQLRKFEPARFDGDMLFFGAARGRPEESPGYESWQRYVTGKVENHELDCDHGGMTQPRNIAEIGRIVAAKLGAVR